jgi:predicted nuclease with TOPRIM domain
MLELNARREAIKQKIREKLQDLSNEEKELNEEMDRLCSSVAEFRERLEMIKGAYRLCS